MKYYAVIDTNVLVSAMLKWQSVGRLCEIRIVKNSYTTSKEFLCQNY